MLLAPCRHINYCAPSAAILTARHVCQYPLRGHKATPWEGGTKVMGFISGGFLPASLYGKTHEGVIHVADFYPTICNLAGVADCTDNKTFPGDPSPGKVRPIGTFLPNILSVTVAAEAEQNSCEQMVMMCGRSSSPVHRSERTTSGCLSHLTRLSTRSAGSSSFGPPAHTGTFRPVVLLHRSLHAAMRHAKQPFQTRPAVTGHAAVRVQVHRRPRHLPPNVKAIFRLATNATRSISVDRKSRSTGAANLT